MTNMNYYYAVAENNGWKESKNYVAARATRIAEEANWEVSETRDISCTGEECTLLTFFRMGQCHDVEISDNDTWDAFLGKVDMFADSANARLRQLYYAFAAA